MRRNHLVRALFVAVLAGTALGSAAGPSGATTGSQAAPLRELASGNWTSDHGTIEFRADGTATFSIRNCGLNMTKPGFGTVGTGCPPTVYTGELGVDEHGYTITQDDGGIVDLQAYVDDDGALHVGVGTIGAVARNRTGKVELWPHDTLTIGKGTCTWAPFVTGERITAPCRYRNRDGRTVLVYRAPDPFERGKTRQEGLVLVPKAGLLVDAGLVPLVYTRT